MKNYDIIFYKKENGASPVFDYIESLFNNNSKKSRIERDKIIGYIDLLRNNGKSLGAPYIKHLVNDIWELRPRDNRILFFSWNGNKFVLLHLFKKRTQKTPKREIDKAVKEIEDFQRRNHSEN